MHLSVLLSQDLLHLGVHLFYRKFSLGSFHSLPVYAVERNMIYSICSLHLCFFFSDQFCLFSMNITGFTAPGVHLFLEKEIFFYMHSCSTHTLQWNMINDICRMHPFVFLSLD
jgi:hypothetical protein